MRRFTSDRELKRRVTGWQHASQSEQNARAPETFPEQHAWKTRDEGEREHVARPSRHVAGLSVDAQMPEDPT
jgi:hypothetical protein